MLEELYSSNIVEKRTQYAFVMGFSYSIIGVFAGLYLFPENPGLAALAFTSLLILPTLNRLMESEELRIAADPEFTIFSVFRNHRVLFSTFFFLFLGILIAFGILSAMLPTLATSVFFNEQVRVLGLSKTLGLGQASGGLSFSSIFWNNFGVLVICFITSFFYGAGAVFVITWNASAWGVFFGVLAKQTAHVAGWNPVAYFFYILLVVFLHMMSEASAYLFTAISGGIVSKATIHEEFGTQRFKRIIRDACFIFFLSLVVLVFASFVEVYVTPYLLSVAGI